MKIIATNKSANYNFSISSKIEAGLVLTGSEVKSLRINTGSIKESYIQEKGGELWLVNCFIKKYFATNNFDINPTRERKLLIKKKELNKLVGAIKKDGMSIIPITLYFNSNGFAKITIALAKGKKRFDKRNAIKTKEWGIKQQRLLKKNSI